MALRDLFRGLQKQKPVLDVVSSNPAVLRSERARRTLPQAQQGIRAAQQQQVKSLTPRGIGEAQLGGIKRGARKIFERQVQPITSASLAISQGRPVEKKQAQQATASVIDFSPVGATTRLTKPIRQVPKSFISKFGKTIGREAQSFLDEAAKFPRKGVRHKFTSKRLRDIAQKFDDIIDPKQVAKAKTDISAGRFRPLVLDKKGNLLDGSHRLEAARQLGVDEVPVVVESRVKPIRERGQFAGSQAGFLDLKEIFTLGGRLGRKASKPSAPTKPEVVSRGVSQVQDAINLAKGTKTKALPAVTRQRSKTLQGLGVSDKAIISPGQRGTSRGLSTSQRTQAQGQVQSLENVVGVDKNISDNMKINLRDMFRTPTKVLQKIGLGKEAEALEQSWGTYKLELPEHLEKISEWLGRLVDDNSSRRVFQALDGQKVELNPVEKEVAEEVAAYLSTWADRLGLPKDRRIAKYISHIFDDQLIKKDFDPDLARLITDKVAGSVYDPFLERRLGKLGYKEDLGLALQAYAKRAIRKVHMDPALQTLKAKEKALEVSQYKYVQRLTDRINMRPTEMDQMLDRLISSVTGGRLSQRPTMRLSQALRTITYRGTLGLNVGSAVRNLTQGVNTFAKLGTRWTMRGYMDIARNLASGSDELMRAGVLDDRFVDLQASALKRRMQKVDAGLFSLFEMAEKINRGAAYYGAKAKALAKGLPEDKAITEAIDLARTTQFKFGPVDTPPLLQSDINKFLLQFQSFNVKQLEFITEMAKNKEYAGLLRYGLGGLLITGTVGNLIGIDLEDWVPFSDIPKGESRVGQTPTVQAVSTGLKAATGGTNKFGQPVTAKDVLKTVPAFIPGGVQAKKSLQGLGSVAQQASITPSGKVRFPVQPTGVDAVRNILFGQFSGKIARFYFDEALKPLGDKDTALYKKMVAGGADPFESWKSIYKRRIQESFQRKIKEIQKDQKMDVAQKRRELQQARQDGERLLRRLNQF